MRNCLRIKYVGYQWNFEAYKQTNVLVKLKRQHPPPPANPGHLTVHPAQGGGNLNVALQRWGI